MTKRNNYTDDAFIRPAPQPWLNAEMFERLTELNEHCLELLLEEAAANSSARAHPLFAGPGELWNALDEHARRRAAACPFLLLDGGFADMRRWSAARGNQVQDQERQTIFFTVPRTTEVARLVFNYAWHLATSHEAAARLLLGMPPACADLVAACSMSQMAMLAVRRPEWLQPRWVGRAPFWRDLLTAAISNDANALELIRMRGVQMLAAEARLAQVVG